MSLSKPTLAALVVIVVASLPTFAASPTAPAFAEVPLRERLARTLEADLLHGMPAADRGAASTILRDKILRWHLRDLATTPSPHYQVSALRAKLDSEVTPYPSERRLAALGDYACRVEAMQQLESAVFLAVARYLDDHADPGASAGYWTTPAARYAHLTAAGLAAEVAAAQAGLDQLRARARTSFPRCVAARHLNFTHAELALEAARSGDFAAAAGSLRDFLLRTGKQPAEIEVELPTSRS